MRSRILAGVAATAVATALVPTVAGSASAQEDRAAAAAEGPVAGQVDDPGVLDPDPGYDAEIRRTEHGVPHVTADSYADMGFGIGYAFAEDNICTAADFYVTVNGERSKFFGPDETWTFHGNGQTFRNLESDFYYTAVNESGVIEDLLDRPPPHGPLEGIREGVRGYVAGYNAYLEDAGGPGGISDPRCSGEEWVRPITEMDAYRRFFQLASLASAGVVVQGIGAAQPPTPPVTDGESSASTAAMPTPEQAAAIEQFPDRFSELLGVGSNAYGLGRDVSSNGRGLVLGNPHFPWHEGERLYQMHLTIPGVTDVAGAALYGVPIVLIGHTDGVGWSHTVSTAFRFTPFQLTLVPGSPTTYLVDGQPREMERRPVSVEVQGEDQPRERTLYWTDYGPVFTELVGIPLPWTPTTAFAMGDVNVHMRYLNHFFEKNHAQSVRELFEIQKRNMGVPWVNTIAADSSGEALYSDVSVVPNVPDDHARECNTALGQATFEALGLPVLDGSRSGCEWLSDDDAPAEGIFGPGNLPHLFRDDYVTNSNDSYWLSNPQEPLTGYARIIGDEETARTLRTRLGLKIVADRADGDDTYTSTPATTWTRQILQDAAFNNRQHAGELTRDAAVQMCRSFPGGMAPSSGGPVAVEQDGVSACDALASWDLRDDLDSDGAILFRRFWGHADDATGGPWANGFDAADPVNTPNTLNTDHPEVQQALGDAINDLVGAGIPLDAPLRGWQYEDRGDGEEIPIHGGPGVLGVFNAINVEWDGDPGDGASGYPNVDHGSSFVMAVQFTGGDCPVDASAIVTYSQSEDVTRPFFKDQTRNYSDKIWNDMAFCDDEIAADPALTTTTVSAAGDGGQSDGADGADGAQAAPAADEPSSPLPATGGGAALLGVLALASAAVVRRR